MISGDSFSRVSVTRPHGKVDTPKPRDPKASMRALTRVHNRVPFWRGMLSKSMDVLRLGSAATAEDGWDPFFGRKRDDVDAYCCIPVRGRNPNAVNAGPKPDAVNAGSKPDVGPKPNAVNAGPELDVGSEPDGVNARPEPDVGPEPKMLVSSWKVGRPLVPSSPCHGGRVKAASGLPVKVGTTLPSRGVGGRDGLGLWSQRISQWRSEDHGGSTREGWHDSPAVRDMVAVVQTLDASNV
ncbi:hypothetical protein CRG98_029695 [Punica granatum]|uniref:Uncharacterized protein n=1 Tax=Punica granatum TaxID=22663 RepID=A0A2I0J0Z9_PUNGR|nr:hypothetical protein CRG98_029695 [Punica granatum]